MPELQTYKKPSSIEFEVVPREEAKEKQPMLSHAGRGDTFLRNGAICVRVEVSMHHAIKDLSPKSHQRIKDKLGELVWVHNLQTGRVFACEDGPIEWIKLRVSVVGK